MNKKKIIFSVFSLIFLSYMLIVLNCNDKAKPKISFGVVSDCQYADIPSKGTRFYRNSIVKLEDCIAEFNRHDLDFVIHLGDLVDKNTTSFDSIFPILEKVKAPVYHVFGNHDIISLGDKQEQILNKLDLQNRYYDFKLSNWRFIILDGMDLNLKIEMADSAKMNRSKALFQKLEIQEAINAETWNGGLDTEQMNWLKSKLETASDVNEKVIIFCHIPVYPKNAHNLWNDDELIELIESYDCVVAFMNGHNHHGNYGEKENIHYVTFQGMVETADSNGFAIVDVYNDYLKINGFGRAKKRVLNIEKNR